MYEQNGKSYIIKINDFAEDHGISLRAVQKKLSADKYRETLVGEFIRTTSDGTWLTQTAADFLAGTLRTQSYGVITTDRYEKQIEELKEKLFSVQEQYTAYVSTTTPLLQKASEQLALAERSEENRALAERLQAEIGDLRADKEKSEELLSEAQKTAQGLSEELTEAKEELERLKKRSLWERIRNK